MNIATRIWIIFLFVTPQIANACDCPPFTTIQEYCGSSAVVVGEIIDVLQQLPSSIPSTSSVPIRPVHYRLIEVFKGNVPEHAFFITPIFDGQCALPVKQGSPALLFIRFFRRICG